MQRGVHFGRRCSVTMNHVWDHAVVPCLNEKTILLVQDTASTTARAVEGAQRLSELVGSLSI